MKRTYQGYIVLTLATLAAICLSACGPVDDRWFTEPTNQTDAGSKPDTPDTTSTDTGNTQVDTTKTEPTSPTLPAPRTTPPPAKAECTTPPPTCLHKGVCANTRPICRNKQWVCEYPKGYEPTETTCDGIDNDCDGEVDETITRSCYDGNPNTKGVGSCRGGTQVCHNGLWGRCEGQITPQAETCDGIDNNCDGQVDENLRRACYTGPANTQGIGRCKGGTQACSAGTWGNCEGEQHPTQEVCDGIDNDCDGQIDAGKLCGDRQICSSGQCQCDTKQGYFPSGNGCVADGDSCPANLALRPYCATSAHWVICDPFGKVGVLHCPSFSGTQCTSVAGIAGCKAPSNMYGKHSCLSLTANYGDKTTWHAVMSGVGTDASNAVIAFNHCVGGGKSFCGTIVTSAGSQTACMCGERNQYCSNLGGNVYDPVVSIGGQCRSFWGNQFGCPAPLSGKNACGKTTVNGFATYTCGF